MRYTDWRVSGYDRPAAVSLVRAGYGPLVATVLSARGIRDAQTADAFLNAGTGTLPDPMELPGMRPAAERLRLAVERKERVAVFGDYDVDGITAGCLMRDYLRSKGVPCLLVIPECREDGYGLSQKSVDLAIEDGDALAVTVDCGITSVAEAEYAASRGLELIVTDHHECGPELPRAAAVVDPKIPGCDFSDKSLAGVGVAFALVCACEGPEALDRLLDEYGDLVALGTVADVMPVTGANRVLIKRGIEMIRQGKRPGIARLAAEAGMELGAVTASGIGFTLAPRLNAAGRMGQTSLAVRLMSAETEKEAAGYAETLCELNASRREIESVMFEEALSMARTEPETAAPIVLSSEHWYLGVAGIVASRLADRLSRPAIVICVSDGVGRGSCRSVSGFSIHAALEAAGDLLLTFGGHEMAAGLTIESGNIEAFRRRMAEFAAGSGEAGAALDVDFCVVKPGLLTPKNVAELSVLEPYGNGNAQPVLCFAGARIEAVSPIGGGRHARYRIGKNGESFDGVAFGRSVREVGFAPGDTVDVAFTPQLNEFRGRCSVQLIIADMRPAGEVQ